MARSQLIQLPAVNKMSVIALFIGLFVVICCFLVCCYHGDRGHLLVVVDGVFFGLALFVFYMLGEFPCCWSRLPFVPFHGFSETAFRCDPRWGGPLFGVCGLLSFC